jgi:hypothetical protein
MGNYSNLSDRVIEIEKALCMILRLPTSIGNKIRLQAFRETISYIIDNPQKDSAFEVNDRSKQSEQRNILLEVQSIFPSIAEMLKVDPNLAKEYVMPLGQAKFDKAVGQLLMSADLSMNSIPNVGSMFLDKIRGNAINFT